MHEEDVLKRGFSSSVYNYVGKVLSNIFVFLTSVYIIKSLTVEEYGIYNILTATLSASLIFHFGIPKIINRYLPEFYEKRKWALLKNLAFWSLAIRLITGIALAGLLLIFRKQFLSLFKFPENLLPYLYLFGLLLIIKIESNLFEYFLDSFLDYAYKSLLTVIYAGLRFFIFYYLLIRGYGIVGIIWAWLAVEILFFLLLGVRNIVLLRPIFEIAKEKDDFDKHLPVRRIARYGGFYYLSGMGGYVLDYTTDNFFISAFLDNVRVGLYSFGARVVGLASQINPISFLQGIITTVLIRKYAENEDRNKLLYAFQLYNKINFFLGFPMLVGLSIMADKIVLYLFAKPEYLQALPIIWSWSFITLFSLLMEVIIPIIRVLERTEIMMFSLFFAAANIALNILLIPKYGIYGAIIATGSVQILAFYFHLYMLRRYIAVKYPWKAYFKIGLNVAAMGLLAFLLRSWIKNFLSLASVSFLCVLFYFGLSFFNQCFAPYDRKVLNEAIGRDIFVF